MKKGLEENRKRLFYRRVMEHGREILHSENFRHTREFIQHGNQTVYRHSLEVAVCSLEISRRLRIRCRERELVRGALLHDYFLYDWHDKIRKGPEGHQRFHGFRHPGIALRNAEQDYELTPRERDIIRKHMWPLTVLPPLCTEAWIVTAADKYCSLRETLRIGK